MRVWGRYMNVNYRVNSGHEKAMLPLSNTKGPMSCVGEGG